MQLSQAEKIYGTKLGTTNYFCFIIIDTIKIMSSINWLSWSRVRALIPYCQWNWQIRHSVRGSRFFPHTLWHPFSDIVTKSKPSTNVVFQHGHPPKSLCSEATSSTNIYYSAYKFGIIETGNYVFEIFVINNQLAQEMHL